MRKFYIPTSTFNFNNILSSESISPKAFYTKRGFGYSRWLPIPENDKDNAVMLYDKPFSFTRMASDIEDHPMLIEIQTDEDFKIIAEGVFCCDHTIYLSPWNTRFIFFTEQDLNVTLSLSESSLETKMVRLYRKGLSIGQYPTMEWSDINIDIPLNEQSIKQDRRINKMKGLLYGHYIGALLSITPEIVRKHNILQELQNIFSAVLSSDNHVPTITQDFQIRSLLFAMQKEIPAIAYLEKQLAEPQRISEIWVELSKLGVVFPSMISANSVINSLMSFTDSKENQAMVWLEKEKKSLQYRKREKRVLLHPDEEDIIISDGNLVKISADILGNGKELELAKAWINDILSSDKYNGKVSSFKVALADDVTYKAKDIYSEQWNDSEAKISLNNMRRYINGNESDFQWKDLLFSSIAAVIAKGNDWEQLLAFMQSKNICDYRLAFAFYGELNGFANLTRDFTDLLLNEESKYVASVYKEFSGQLLGVDSTTETALLEEATPMSKSFLDNISKPVATTAMQTWKEYAESYIKNKVTNNNQMKAALDVLMDSTIFTVEQFLFHLQSCKGWKKGKTINGLKEYLHSQNSMFSEYSQEKDNKAESPSIIDDDDAVKRIEGFTMLTTELKLIIVALFKDFQKNYRSGYYFKNQEQYHRNNSDVIDHFCKWCLSKKNNRAIMYSRENSAKLDELKKYLMSYYHD